MKIESDKLGILTSCLCMIHCLSGPILLMLGITAAGQTLMNEEIIHIGLLVPILLIALLSLPSGYKKHRHPIPSLLAFLGIVCMISALLIENLELILTIMASCILITAHLSNLKLLRAQ